MLIAFIMLLVYYISYKQKLKKKNLHIYFGIIAISY